MPNAKIKDKYRIHRYDTRHETKKWRYLSMNENYGTFYSGFTDEFRKLLHKYFGIYGSVISIEGKLFA